MPEHERERRRGEIAAHVFDATHERTRGIRSRLRLAAECIRGAFDDVVWCNDVRRQRGMPHLVLELMLGQVGATFIAGVAIVAAFAFSLTDMGPFPFLREAAVAVAGGVTAASVADRLLRRRRARRKS